MKRALFLLAIFSVLCRTAVGAVWYVDGDNVSGAQDGTSWATAFTTIQEGIDAAFADGGGSTAGSQGMRSNANSATGSLSLPPSTDRLPAAANRPTTSLSVPIMPLSTGSQSLAGMRTATVAAGCTILVFPQQ